MNAYTWTVVVALALAAGAGWAASGAGGSPAPATQPAPAEGNAVAVLKTSAGDLVIHPLNHSALRFEFRGKQYYVDPSGKADWDKLPKADAILITHEHGDHLDAKVIDKIKKEGTVIVASAPAAKKAPAGTGAIAVGQVKGVLDANVEAVAAYNLTADRLNYHPKSRGDCGFVITFGDKRVYVAGDTEETPEMKALKGIDVAFLPINLPYTMTPKEAAEAAMDFKPKVLYPYHQGRSAPAEVKRLLAGERSIEVRVLPLP
jgi:L-ascorbate metabolism protein UlaG (beta-lactamase superfamily)